MSKSKSYKFELAIILGAFGIFGIFFGGLAGFTHWASQRSYVETVSADNPLSSGLLDKRVSEGSKSLLPTPSASKQQGITAYASGNYAEAVSQLETALKETRNDPETLIYLNNAKIGEQLSHTIAVIAPINQSGEIGLEILRGVAQAQQAYNQSTGVESVPIKVLIVNDDNDPKIAKALAQKLVDNPDVMGVVGHYSSGVTLAAAPVYNQGQLPMISAISTSVELSGFSPYVFRTVPSDSFAAAALARYMIHDLAAKKAVLYYDSNSAYSLSLKSEFATSVFSDGGEVILEYDLAAKDFNATQQLQVAQEQNADVIMLAASTDTHESTLAVINENNQQLPLLGGDDLYHPHILEAGKDQAVGLVVAVPWHVLADADSAFVQAARDIWGGDVSWRTAMAYDAFAAFGTALSSAKHRDGIQQALAPGSFSAAGATGEVHFLPSGDRNRAAQLVEIQAGQRSGTGFDFVPVQ